MVRVSKGAGQATRADGACEATAVPRSLCVRDFSARAPAHRTRLVVVLGHVVAPKADRERQVAVVVAAVVRRPCSGHRALQPTNSDAGNRRNARAAPPYRCPSRVAPPPWQPLSSWPAHTSQTLGTLRCRRTSTVTGTPGTCTSTACVHQSHQSAQFHQPPANVWRAVCGVWLGMRSPQLARWPHADFYLRDGSAADEGCHGLGVGVHEVGVDLQGRAAGEQRLLVDEQRDIL